MSFRKVASQEFQGQLKGWLVFRAARKSKNSRAQDPAARPVEMFGAKD